MLVRVRVEFLGRFLPEFLISGSTMDSPIPFAVTYLTLGAASLVSVSADVM